MMGKGDRSEDQAHGFNELMHNLKSCWEAKIISKIISCNKTPDSLGSNFHSHPGIFTDLLWEIIDTVTGLAAEVNWHFQGKRYWTVKLQTWMWSFSESSILVSTTTGWACENMFNSRSCLKYQISLHFNTQPILLSISSPSSSSHHRFFLFSAEISVVSSFIQALSFWRKEMVLIVKAGHCLGLFYHFIRKMWRPLKG